MYPHKEHFQLVCMSAIGTLNRTINNDTAYHYLTSALKLAEELDDLNNYYVILNTLAGYYFNINDYEPAKNILPFRFHISFPKGTAGRCRAEKYVWSICPVHSGTDRPRFLLTASDSAG